MTMDMPCVERLLKPNSEQLKQCGYFRNYVYFKRQVWRLQLGWGAYLAYKARDQYVGIYDNSAYIHGWDAAMRFVHSD